MTRANAHDLNQASSALTVGYPCFFRNAAQRFFCAAAMRLRASGLNTRLRLVTPGPLTDAAIDTWADLFGRLPAGPASTALALSVRLTSASELLILAAQLLESLGLGRRKVLPYTFLSITEPKLFH